MKRKPDLGAFVRAKDPTAFLEGGAADLAEKSPALKARASRRPRAPQVQKLFHFSEDLASRLKERAHRRSREAGVRVTERDIVIEALEAYLKGH